MFLSQITSSSRMSINSFLVSLRMKQICRSRIKEFHKHQKALYSVFNGQSKEVVDPNKFGEISKCDNENVNQYEQKNENSYSNVLHYKSLRKSQGISDIGKLHPHPLSFLMNFYSIVNNEFQKKCVTLSYKENDMKKKCNITITWPCTMTFASDGSKKKQAAHDAALKCLQWLYENNYIKEQRPVLYSTTQLKELLLESKKPIPINIESDFKNEIKALINTFEDDIESVITKSPGTDFEKLDQEEVSTVKVSSSVSTALNTELAKMLEKRKGRITKLPIHDYREEILDSIQHNQVVLIKGDTGCGKSTQIPQFIMDAYTEQNKASECNIIVSQPRKVAAISLADRVASERYECVGDIVGYHVRFDNKLPKLPSSIVFYTTGVLLRLLETNPTLKGISHIIMDEVHERSLQSDMLLKLLKEILKSNPSLKLILMSATINVDLFKQYFSCKVVDIPGRTYPVKTYFKEDIEIFKNNYERQNYERTQVPFDKVVELVQWIIKNKPPGNILCFLPGWQEIKHVHKLLKERNINLLILPLHSKVPFEIQQKAFQPISGKIILATDVAESSITIKDVSYVIDTAIRKEKKWYKGDSVPVLEANLISKSNLLQRKGRAGRVGPGESYHLITKEEFDSLDVYPEPEILRTPLEEAIIISRKLSNENIFDFFNSMLDAPDNATLSYARDNLKLLGILDDNENLTSLGKRVSYFSLDPRLSRAIILSCVFQCLRPILLLTSFPLGETSVLSLNEETNEKIAIKSHKFEFHKTSDHIAMIKYFDYWKSCNEEPGDIYIPSFFHMVKKFYALHMTELKTSGMLQSYNTEFANTCCDNNELIRATIFAATNHVLKRSAYGFKRQSFVKQDSFTSEDSKSVVLANSSVNYKTQNWPSNILTYVRKMKFSRGHTVFETSMLTPLSVLLFSHNDIHCWEKDENFSSIGTQEVVIRISNVKNVTFCTDKETAELLLNLRNILWKVVNYIIDNEGVDHNRDNLIMVKSYKKELIDFIASMLQEASKDIDAIDCVN